MACSLISFLNFCNLKSSQSFSLGAATFAFEVNGLQAVSFDTHCFWVSAPSSTRSPVQSQLFPLCVLGTPQWLRGWRSPIEAALIATLKLNWTAQSEYIHTHMHILTHCKTRIHTPIKCEMFCAFLFSVFSTFSECFAVYSIQIAKVSLAIQLREEQEREERVERSGGTRALCLR